MRRTGFKRLPAVALSLLLATQGAVPSVALAAQRAVEINNHTAASEHATPITNITIDDVDKPAVGSKLDKTAVVSASGDAKWEIPVIWVRDDLHMGDETAQEGHTYLPVLTFFVPREYTLAENTVTVTLSDSLSQLFGTQEIISVYDAGKGITYIIPATFKDLFAPARRAEQDTAASADAPTNMSADDPDDDYDFDSEIIGYGGGDTIAEIFCSMTARNVLGDAELQWLVELIRDYLEPQAVNLLLQNFPSMSKAAENGEIGKQLSLYIYYQKGDKDGKFEHESAEEALAYVDKGPIKVDGAYKFGYLLAVDVDDLLERDANGKPVVNPEDKTYRLVRSGPAMETFKNTIVHELFHALMDDYNRTGMAGATNLEDIVTDSKGYFIKKGVAARYNALHYPSWFIEGSASAVENVYQFRNYVFQILRRGVGSDGQQGTGAVNNSFTQPLILNNYLNSKHPNGKYTYFELEWSYGGRDGNGQPIDSDISKYTTGYLATLYLSELSARYAYNGKSSVKTENGVTTVDSDMLRGGLDLLLKWMHEGQTLDELINALSPKDESGNALYTDTKSFEEQFIRGKKSERGTYFTGSDSMNFVESYLNYMLYLDNKLPENEHPNGSILEDFSKRYTSTLDTNKQATSPYLQIIDSNVMIPSTVKSDTASIGKGRSDPDASAGAVKTQTEAEEQAELPLAAKAVAKDADASDTEATEAEVVETAEAEEELVEVADEPSGTTEEASADTTAEPAEVEATETNENAEA